MAASTDEPGRADVNVVQVFCNTANLGAAMTEMRGWLDRNQAETSLFELLSPRAGGVVLRLEFSQQRHAIEFAAVFGGKVLAPQRAAA